MSTPAGAAGPAAEDLGTCQWQCHTPGTTTWWWCNLPALHDDDHALVVEHVVVATAAGYTLREVAP